MCKEIKVFFIGFDNVGKLIIFYCIIIGVVVVFVFIVGSNYEVYDYKGVWFGLIDIGG